MYTVILTFYKLCYNARMINRLVSIIFGFISATCLVVGVYFLGSWGWEMYQEYQDDAGLIVEPVPTKVGGAGQISETNTLDNPIIDDAVHNSDIVEEAEIMIETDQSGGVEIETDKNPNLDDILYSYQLGDQAQGDLLDETQRVPNIVIFDDPLCPYCAQYWLGTLQKLSEQKPAHIKVSYHTVPAHGEASSQIGRYFVCAAEQDNISAYKTAWYQSDTKDKQVAEQIISQQKLDKNIFRDCLSSDIIDAALQKDVELATMLKVDVVPTTFVGEKKFEGIVPVENILKAIASYS